MATAMINNEDIDIDFDHQLGLNLVFANPTKNNNSTPDVIGKNPKKRKTKYDRRRERGRLAKLAKLEEQQQQQQQHHHALIEANSVKKNNNSSSGHDGKERHVANDSNNERNSVTEKEVSSSLSTSSSLAGIAATLNVAMGRRNSLPSSSSVAQSPSTLELSHRGNSDNDIDDASVDHANNNNNNAGESLNMNSKPLESMKPSSHASSSSSLVLDTVPTSSSPSGEDFAMISSSRRHRDQTSLTEKQRAKYLSEFHARPRDLDRCERASRVIKESCASDHIFAQQDEYSNNDENDDDDADEKAEVDRQEVKTTMARTTTTTTTTTTKTCPFSKLGLHSKLVSTLTSPTGHFKLSQPTIIQSRCIAALLPKNVTRRINSTRKSSKSSSSSSSNLFVQSETGSGKTLAYLLPILQHLAVAAPGDDDDGQSVVKRIDRQMGGTRCIILCPTRELATQTYTFANHLCRSFPWIIPGCFSGGEKRKSEKARLRKGISILIGTPGRLLDHLSKTESLLMALKNKLEWLVLDEADRCLDAGLGGQVEQIVQYLRSNQPGAGPKRNGVTWRSVLVSATVTADIEGLAKTVLGGEKWLWARGHVVKSSTVGGEMMQLVECDDGGVADLQTLTNGKDTDKNGTKCNQLDNATPQQLAQLFIVVNAKLRLISLIAFLSARAAKGERTVVFLSTCDSVDYHHALLTSMESILGNDKDVADDGVVSGGIFGKACPIFKLHGDIPHSKRMTTINEFNSNQQSAILLATDVAGRGLNFPSLDWIVQYDPPCETNDYCHRAGRSARAGQAGHALLFLLPSERQYIEVLRLRGLKDISALSLSSTLTTAAALCTGVTQEVDAKSMGNKFSDGGSEAFTTAIQNRLEQCVIQNDLDYKASIDTKFKGDPKQRRRQKKDAVGPLLEGARKAFTAFVRAYPAKEKAVRHIFNARALHLGHVARSLALRETPKMVSKGYIVINNESKSTQSGAGDGDKRKSRLAFGNNPAEADDNKDFDDSEQSRNLSLLSDAIGVENEGLSRAGYVSRRKVKLQSGERRTKQNDVQKRMMEAAIELQTQEFM